MAFVLADWSITRNAGNLDVRYIGLDHAAAASYSTTIELHRGLQALADDEVDSNDDELSIIDKTPSDRGGADTNISLINGCNIDDASSQHIYDGSITQAGGDTIYDGIQVFGNASIIQVIQNGARIDDDFWNYTNHKAATSDTASGTTHRFVVKTRDNGVDIDGRKLLGTQRELGTVYTEFFIGGGTNRGNNVLALKADSNLNNQTIEATIATWADIVNDVAGFTPITIGGVAYDFYSDWELGARSKNEFYERGQWIQTRIGTIGGGGDTRGAAQILYGLPGDIFSGITHSVVVDTPTGTCAGAERVTWGTAIDITAGSFVVGNTYRIVTPGTTDFTLIGAVDSNAGTIFTATGIGAGTGDAETITGWGQLLAINSTTAATECWIQLLAGVAPANNQSIEGITSGATCLVAVTVTAQTVSLPFVGASTGTAIIGAFGLGIGADDLTQNELVFDLTGTPRTPPNNITFTVNNILEDDYIIVANNSGGDFDFSQRLTNATYSGAITAIVTTAAIPTDIPASGTLRIELDDGSYQRVTYLSFTASIFDVTGTTLASQATIGNNLFITYIDKVATAGDETATFVSSTYVYNAPRTLFTRVRNAGTGANTAIKTFETTSASGTSGGAATVGRIDDF